LRTSRTLSLSEGGSDLAMVLLQDSDCMYLNEDVRHATGVVLPCLVLLTGHIRGLLLCIFSNVTRLESGEKSNHFSELAFHYQMTQTQISRILSCESSEMSV
jgi:hypothetical protein